jgi:Mg2+/Co2+ transporter CorB
MATLLLELVSVGVVGLLLALSAFFSSSESAIFSLPDVVNRSRKTETSGAHQTLARLRANPHRLLVTILVGNNIVNIAITSIVTLIVARVAPPGAAVLITTVCVSVIILVFGEIVPKAYGLGQAERWSLRVARPLSWVTRALGPLVIVFDVVTRELTRLVGGDQRIEDSYLEES